MIQLINITNSDTNCLTLRIDVLAVFDVNIYSSIDKVK